MDSTPMPSEKGEQRDVIIAPYKHDSCSTCKWVGWVVADGKYGNMYICRKGKLTEILIRWSDEPSDYSCYLTHDDSTPEPRSIKIVGK